MRCNWPLFLLLVIVLGATAVRAEHSDSPHRQDGRSEPARVAGTPAAYRDLSQRRTNRCDLQPRQVMALPNTSRLQGACCSTMDRAHYREQVRGLQRYRALSEIPRDPYDIRASLAKHLLRYDRSVHLSRAEQATYERAMRMTDEKGPCCCHCWRWNAFEGLARHLIADRGWRAAQVAEVIGLIDGCGGSG